MDRIQLARNLFPERTSYAVAIRPTMLRLMHNLLVILLVTAIAAACTMESVPAQLRTVPHRRHAGCHEQMPTSPKPADFVCCVSGHDAALPSVSFDTFPGMSSQQECVLASAVTSACLTFSLGTMTSGDPPGATPLRV